MLCEECQKNEATFSITITSGDEITTRHLCVECMKKMELSLSQGDIQSFLSSILSVLGSVKTDDSPVCSGCGLHYSTFERTGKLGCAQCYRDFSEQLKPLLQRIHGCTQHVGHLPSDYASHHAQAEAATAKAAATAQAAGNHQAAMPNSAATAALQRQQDLLRKKMDEAVACENFEDAAKYRDELRQLQSEGEIAP